MPLICSQVRTLTQGSTTAKKGSGRMHRQGLTVMQSSKVRLRFAQAATLVRGVVGKRIRAGDPVA